MRMQFELFGRKQFEFNMKPSILTSGILVSSEVISAGEEHLLVLGVEGQQFKIVEISLPSETKQGFGTRTTGYPNILVRKDGDVYQRLTDDTEDDDGWENISDDFDPKVIVQTFVDTRELIIVTDGPDYE